ncbi:hypothetical protein [Candidatus Nitrospira bockiana]
MNLMRAVVGGSRLKPQHDKKPSQPPGEQSPPELGVSPEPGSDQPPMEEKGMEEAADRELNQSMRSPGF